MAMFDFKIISGGQSGADLGGIKFAQIHQIDHEINTHKGFRPIRGKIPDNVKVNYITERMGIPGLRIRTEYNVKNSDITIIFVQKDLNKTKGSRLTAKFCQGHNKPHIVIRLLRNLNFGEIERVEEYEYVCEYIDKNKDKKSIELNEISHRLSLLREDLIKNGAMINKTNKLIVNIAGERYWNEDRIVKILEDIFGA